MNLLDIFFKYYLFFIFLLGILLVFLFLSNNTELNSKINLEQINHTKIEENIINDTSNIVNKTILILENKSMYHCLKLKDNKTVYEIYLSNNNFYEYFNYDTPFFRTYINDNLYEEVLDNPNCNLVIRKYDNIYENFKLNFEYNSHKYKCQIIDLNESIFKIDNSLTICQDYLDYGIEVIAHEN